MASNYVTNCNNTSFANLVLARSGGRRETDTLTVFPIPEPDSEGRYCLHFFLHRLRYLPPCATRAN
jgi:hypothetical protein